MNKQVVSLAIGLAPVFLLMCGCPAGQGGLPQRIAGTVTKDNKPVAEADVSIIPQGQQGPSAGAKTDANGKFDITLRGEAIHLKPGSYVVLVAKYVDKNGNPIVEDQEAGIDIEHYRLTGELHSALPEKYNDPEKSDLRVDIKPGDNIDLKINIP